MKNDYNQGYRQGQVDLIKKWKKWNFGNWFFGRQKKQIDKFIKEMDLDVEDIKII